MEYYIEDLTDEGLGVSKKDGKVYFVNGAKLFETVSIKNERISKNIIFADVDKVIRKSDASYYMEDADNIDKKEIFLKNPSATLKEIKYENQVSFKINNINSKLERIGKIEKKLDYFVKSDNIYNYRNKARFKIKEGKAGYFKGKSNELVEIDYCVLSSVNINNAFRNLKEVDKKYNIFKLLEKNFVSEIVFKEDINEKVYIFLKSLHNKSGVNLNELEKIAEIIKENSNEIEDVLISDRNIVMGIGKRKYNVKFNSFFQVNKFMNDKLYNEVVNILKEKENENQGKLNILELYSGVGSIGIYISEFAKSILGIEIVKDATKNAKENVILNNVKNAKYICYDAEKSINSYLNDKDILIIDPPRKGMEKAVIDEIAKSKIKDIIYVSCSPATLARDIKIFNEKGYELKKIVGVDMFPNTLHVETVAYLSKKEGNKYIKKAD